MSKRFCGGIFFDPKLMIELGVEHPVSLLYYLTYENKSYGIEIVKIQYNEDSKMTREVGNIDDISENEAEVISIINKLKEKLCYTYRNERYNRGYEIRDYPYTIATRT